jgi:hypothetical protein
MIGVAFLNELVFMAIGCVVGWFLGKSYAQTKQWLKDKGFIKNRNTRG